MAGDDVNELSRAFQQNVIWPIDHALVSLEECAMDPLTNLYDRLRQTNGVSPPVEPPVLEDWLRYWNDDDTEVGNLRNIEHWLARSRTPHA